MRNIFLLFLLVLFILPTISISGAPATHSPASNNIRYEVRAAWLTTLMGLDWPAKPATTEAQAELQRRDLCRQLDQLKAAGINMVLFQSRIRSTTAYASDIEPWDGVFTGRPGQRPLYDPLLFAINECPSTPRIANVVRLVTQHRVHSNHETSNGLSPHISLRANNLVSPKVVLL